jgi:hypothetical protein
MGGSAIIQNEWCLQHCTPHLLPNPFITYLWHVVKSVPLKIFLRTQWLLKGILPISKHINLSSKIPFFTFKQHLYIYYGTIQWKSGPSFLNIWGQPCGTIRAEQTWHSYLLFDTPAPWVSKHYVILLRQNINSHTSNSSFNNSLHTQ